jgi:hypothetical protein
MGIKGENRRPRRRRYKRRAEIPQVTTSFRQTPATSTTDKTDTNAVTKQADYRAMGYEGVPSCTDLSTFLRNQMSSFSRQNT